MRPYIRIPSVSKFASWFQLAEKSRPRHGVKNTRLVEVEEARSFYRSSPPLLSCTPRQLLAPAGLRRPDTTGRTAARPVIATDSLIKKIRQRRLLLGIGARED